MCFLITVPYTMTVWFYYYQLTFKPIGTLPSLILDQLVHAGHASVSYAFV